MYSSFTEQAGDYFLDLPERELAAIWEDIASTPPDTPADLWKKKLNKIARENRFSSRFALMRILYSRARGCEISSMEQTPVPAAGGDFEAVVEGELCCFRDISMAHAQTLTPEENTQYIACLLELAQRQADSDPDVNEWIICRAWYDLESANAAVQARLSEDTGLDAKLRKASQAAAEKENKAKYKNRLTRDEAMQLGHILDFSLTEMQWYLFRVFDVEEGFRFNESNDLIEAYGFLTGASWQHVRQLKEQYARLSADIEKKNSPDRDRNWTQNVSDTLLGEVENWARFPDTMDAQFLKWIQSKAWGLDVPSQTARRIYRNLAAFAYDLLTGAETTPNDREFSDCMEDIYREADESPIVRKLLYEEDKVSPRLCKKMADALLLENKIQAASIQADNAKAWHILSVRSDGSLSSAGGMVNSSRTRVADILFGSVQAEKGDMLYLLWFLANLVWQSSDAPDEQALSYRVMDFMDTAQYLLEAAMLPGFYPPHAMEQSMLLSIVYGVKGDEDSSVVYEYMLYTLTESRERKKGSKKRGPDFRLQVVTYYRTHPEVTLEECAKKFEISPQSLSRWQKELLEEGKI